MKGYLLRESTMIAIVIASINLLLIISQVIVSYPLLTFRVAIQPLVHSMSSAFLMHGMHYFCRDYYSTFARTLQKVRRPLKFILAALLCWALYYSNIIRIGVVGHLTWRGIQEICNQRKRLKMSSRTIGIDVHLADSTEKSRNWREAWLTTAIENTQRNIEKLTPKFVRTAFLNGVNSCKVLVYSIAKLEIPSLSRGLINLSDLNSTAVLNSETVKTVTAPTGNIQFVNSAESRDNEDMSPSRRQRPPTLVRFKFSDSKDKPSADNLNGSVGGRKTTSSAGGKKTVLDNENSHRAAAAQKSVSFVDSYQSSASASGVRNGTKTLDPPGISQELVSRGAVTMSQTTRRATNTSRSNSKDQKTQVAFVEELETEFDHESNERRPVTPSHNGRRGASPSSARNGTHEVEALEDTDDTVNLNDISAIAQDDTSINSSGFFSAKKRQYPFSPQHDESTSDQRSDTVDEYEYQEKKRLGNEFRSVLLGARALIVSHGPNRNGNGNSNVHSSSKRERGDDDYDERENDRRNRFLRIDDSMPYTERRVASIPTRSDDTRTEQAGGRPILKRTRKVTDSEQDRDRGSLDDEMRNYQKSQFQMKTNRRKSEVLRGVSFLLGGEVLFSFYQRSKSLLS
jgi:hypothetical protein